MLDDTILEIIDRFELNDSLGQEDILKLIEILRLKDKSVELYEKIIREGRHLTMNP